MEISNGSSIKSKSKGKTKSIVVDDQSDNLPMSDLELLANKKKINKPPEIPVADILSAKVESEKKSSRKPSKRSYKKSSNTTSSSNMTTVNTSDYQKDKARKINKENKNEKIRFQKNKLLYDIAQMNIRGNVSQLKLDMNCSLEEIEREYNRIKTNKQAEIVVGLCKKGLLLGVQGLEALNTNFDPLGIDLVGWSESMNYSMENRDFDDVLQELYEKHKGKETWSPEARLVMLILGSAVMFSVTKKMSNMDTGPNSFLGNILSGFMNKPPPTQPPPQFNQQPPQFNQQPPQFTPPQFHQPPPQFTQQHPFRVPQQHQHQHQQHQFPQGHQPQQQFIPTPFDLNQVHNNRNNETMSDNSSDNQPSKLRGPDNTFDTPDTIDLANIMKKMDKNKNNNNDNELDLLLEETEVEKVIKSKPRGRPVNKKKRGIVA